MAMLRIIFVACLLLRGVWAGETGTVVELTAAEQLVKAGFLLNFAKFTTWPTNALPAESAPFVIGVLGTDPFGPVLDRAVSGQFLQGRPVVVKRCTTMNEARACPLLFIAQSETERLDSILSTLASAPVLTVSDLDNFAARGGMIELERFEGRIVFRVNRDAADRAGITFSSKLLRLARKILVRPVPGRG